MLIHMDHRQANHLGGLAELVLDDRHREARRPRHAIVWRGFVSDIAPDIITALAVQRDLGAARDRITQDGEAVGLFDDEATEFQAIELDCKNRTAPAEDCRMLGCYGQSIID